VPKPGYKLVKSLFGKYEEIPEEWELLPFEKLCEKITDGTHFTPTYVEEGIPFISTENIHPSIRGFDFSRYRKYITEKEHKQLIKRAKPEKGDILVSKCGTIGRTKLIDIDLEVSLFVGLMLLKLKKNLVNGKFIEQILNSEPFHKKMQIMAPGSTRKTLTITNISNLLLPIPPILEQQKIASILSNVDELISSYDKTIQTTKKLKKGLMQTLLTRGMGHKKFKKVKWLFGKDIEIPEEWKITVIGNEFVIGPGGTPKTSNSKFFKGNVNWVTTSDLNRGIINTSTALITEEAVRETHLKIYPKGSFVIAAIGVDASHTRGNCGILSFDAAINQVCLVFKKSESVLTEFFYYYYLQFANNLIFKYSQGTKQWAFYPYVIKKIPFVLPSLEEQQKIASILSSVDDKISKLESKKKSAESLKKGLMQKLLTGQIRVKV
jgi:type I restriction enzyme, S subunit